MKKGRAGSRIKNKKWGIMHAQLLNWNPTGNEKAIFNNSRGYIAGESWGRYKKKRASSSHIW